MVFILFAGGKFSVLVILRIVLLWSFCWGQRHKQWPCDLTVFLSVLTSTNQCLQILGLKPLSNECKTLSTIFAIERKNITTSKYRFTFRFDTQSKQHTVCYILFKHFTFTCVKHVDKGLFSCHIK